ncbi:C40 family peptidase [Chitinimonas taiwanensis]|uniref:Cell wall-associated hydrolase, NlpC family n=1 Tax=Chitinimonas taiwanensis DSM 18899 TaxID=1121279 RepID=A0A1K2H968_9NEIS|nr:C40 family peptidase [Chitinimonas taiwanensis]SFZ72689.1 Cell wall-associated hydrolase, NlpC family [Chitinimonas taiwanensis DSM 18899]
MNPLNLDGMPSILLDPHLPSRQPKRPPLRKSRLARVRTPLLCALIALLLSACGSNPPSKPVARAPAKPALSSIQINDDAGREIVMYALGLLDVGYVFGGKNPEAGLDCSGMVSFIYRHAVGVDLLGSAADMARKGRPISREQLQAGDLVFFNTMNRPFSHVGIYIGDDKFVHAPTSKGRIRIESIRNKYFAARFEAARSYFAG